LIKVLREKGQSISENDVNNIQKLVESSIFDDDECKDLKATLVDIGEFIKECCDMDKIQPQLDKMKA
jgi:endonuclease III-like uncharacterized protein